METAHNSEDLFASQDDTSLREAQIAAEPSQLNTIGNNEPTGQHKRANGEEFHNTVENETPDLVFSEDVDFGEHSEKQQTASEPESGTTDAEVPNLVKQPAENEVDFEADLEAELETELVDLRMEAEEERTNKESADNDDELLNELGEPIDVADGESASKTNKELSEERLAQFPLARVKQIMKLDPDVGIVSAEAIFLVTKAAELFVQTLAKDTYTHTIASKKKTMGLKDVELAIESIDSLMFLEGMMKDN
ncbi:DNA polymerase epsilon subunit 4 [Anopheles ziemanni]|uniref:DNA polymerase epsilon subunit 4 n=1 Tax=Anopheles coustani TaxID=139045 RepID=UPI002658B6FE|nr:DNA polymerase epsilon subunit 4 [Anopheles coustani]XP_058178582.1 DNA polymerase epsilon subunit 4 [Anopheles ziemanni]